MGGDEFLESGLCAQKKSSSASVKPTLRMRSAVSTRTSRARTVWPCLTVKFYFIPYQYYAE